MISQLSTHMDGLTDEEVQAALDTMLDREEHGGTMARAVDRKAIKWMMDLWKHQETKGAGKGGWHKVLFDKMWEMATAGDSQVPARTRAQLIQTLYREQTRTARDAMERVLGGGVTDGAPPPELIWEDVGEGDGDEAGNESQVR